MDTRKGPENERAETKLLISGSGLFFDPVAGGGGGTQNVSWTNTQGVSVSANNLTKTAATG